MPALVSAAISTGFTTAYLSSIYLLPSTRIDLSPSAPSASLPPATAAAAAAPDGPLAETIPASDEPPRDRNHPSVIKARLTAVSVSTLVSLLAMPYLLPPSSSSIHTLALLGLRLPGTVGEGVRLFVLPLGLTATLFSGSLYIRYLMKELPGQRGWSVRESFGGLQGLRNYVVGPLTEELVFRSCVVGISFVGGMSKKQLVFLTPLYFGLAHVHHAYEVYLKGGKTKQALIQGVAGSTFQFAYTTLFGWYASFLFMRTGSILPPFLAHSFCNMMGLPPLGWALQAFPNHKKSLWTTYGLGIAGFIYGFWRWTEPAFFGDSLYWP